MFKKNKKVQTATPKLVSFKPMELAESRTIAKQLLFGNVVLVDFSDTPAALSVRIVDFISGMLLAVEGDYRKIAPKLFLLSTDKEASDKIEAEIKAKNE